MVKLLDRKKSVVTGQENLELVKTVRDFPALVGCTAQEREADVQADLRFCICRDSGIVQLDRVFPLDFIYQQYHSEALGKTWEEHHAEFVAWMKGFGSGDVLEIGGSNGYMANLYLKDFPGVKWTIVEPNPAVEETANIKVIKKVFDGSFRMKGKALFIMHSHLFEHMYEPDGFIRQISELAPVGGRQVFSVPDLEHYLKERQSNFMNFEHTVYLSGFYIEHFLKRYGWKIFEKKKWRGHSLFYAAEKISDKVGKAVPAENQYEANRAELEEYFRYFESLVEKYNEAAQTTEGPAYVFGAHVFSQFLLKLGLREALFAGVLDNSDLKEGKRLYETGLKVFKPAVIKEARAPLVIVRAGAYQKDITSQLRELNKKVKIIE